MVSIVNIKQKTILINFVIIIVLMFASIKKNILVNNDIMLLFLWCGIAYASIILLIIIYSLFKNNSQLRKNWESVFNRIWVILFACIVIMPFISIISFSIGIPATLHFITAKDSEITVTVRKKHHTFLGGSNHCDGGVRLKEYKYFINDKICNITEFDWDRLEVGNKILLIGKKSPFGFTIEKYKKLTSGSS